jgi:T-complex protein 1 subunit theta
MTSAGLPYGLQAMLKDGHRHFAGVDEAVLKNIEAVKAIAACCASSMGPHGARARKRERGVCVC